MPENTTIFTKIINKELPAHIIYEDDQFLAFLDINPVNVGHSLLIPKQACRNIFDMPENLVGEFGKIAQKISRALKKALKADGLNLIMNNERAGGQIIFHAHLHIIPRFLNDGLKNWPGQSGLAENIFEETANKIRLELN
jgi:histidine triad (HIT) family protein